METRKESLNALKLCRFCLSQDETLTSLYDKSQAPKNSVPLTLKILSCISVEVFPSDKMPTYICKRCKFFMDLTYEFKYICRQADENILQYVQDGTPLESISWPCALKKILNLGQNKSADVGVMQTVVEGGATVQVMAHEVSDSDIDDENLYNIKIGGSEEESKSPHIKLVTSTDKQEDTTAKSKRAHKGFTLVSKLTRHVRTHAGERAYPCKYCDKSFIKSYHYTRHLRMKHRETIRSPRGPFGAIDQYRCEQCEDSFATQDELIYHSAIHATQNLICPLCQEKFEDVDAVTAHIKSHVNGVEFMCDFCELVFTSKDKLDSHMVIVHEEEMRASEQTMGLDESSLELDADDDEEDNDNGINVKEEDDHMLVEIKKADDFMLPTTQGDIEERIENTNSEDSEVETRYTELSTVDTLALAKKEAGKSSEKSSVKISHGVTITKTSMLPGKTADVNENQSASIIRKAEEVKRKVVHRQASNTTSDKRINYNAKADGNNTVGASDKSLRLLEKELQELKRTNPRSEAAKTPAKTVDMMRNRRPQVHTSTPKFRAVEKKEIQTTKLPVVEKKLPERRVITKENKEPKETKSIPSVKEDKEREKEIKDKETPKGVMKNGSSEKTGADEGIRRSTRPSKIKDYARMIRDRSQNSDDEIDSDDADDDEEYKEADKTLEGRPKIRRSSIRPQVKAAQTPAAVQVARKRGRPRKDHRAVKIKKEDIEDDGERGEKVEVDDDKINEPSTSTEGIYENKIRFEESSNSDAGKSAGGEQKLPANIMVSPTGQTLKKVPIKSLPPGVRPLPLPINSRSLGGEVCEMQIGMKVVKVQKIVMTKAEVEAMAKKGLVEMKDGTMVLKQGIKLPTSDPAAFKSTLVAEGEAERESPSKKDKAAPMRYDFGDDA